MKSTDIKFILLLFLGIAGGIFIAWMDSRPHWDDTGITVGLILVSSFLFGISMPNRAWLGALAVGLWTPLWEISSSHSYGSIAALVVAFVGSYLGAIARKVVTPSVKIR